MWTATLDSKQITAEGYTVVVAFSNEKTTYTKSFTTDNPDKDWLVDVCKSEIENLKPISTYDDGLELGAVIIEGKP